MNELAILILKDKVVELRKQLIDAEKSIRTLAPRNQAVFLKSAIININLQINELEASIKILKANNTIIN